MTIPQGSAIRSDAFQGQVALTRYHGKGWLRDEIKNFSGFAFFVIVGIAFATYVLGTRVIDPTNISWLSWDSADAHLGWQFFRNEEYLSLPLGWASSIGYPKGIAIAYFILSR